MRRANGNSGNDDPSGPTGPPAKHRAIRRQNGVPQQGPNDPQEIAENAIMNEDDGICFEGEVQNGPGLDFYREEARKQKEAGLRKGSPQKKVPQLTKEELKKLEYKIERLEYTIRMNDEATRRAKNVIVEFDNIRYLLNWYLSRDRFGGIKRKMIDLQKELPQHNDEEGAQLKASVLEMHNKILRQQQAVRNMVVKFNCNPPVGVSLQAPELHSPIPENTVPPEDCRFIKEGRSLEWDVYRLNWKCPENPLDFLNCVPIITDADVDFNDEYEVVHQRIADYRKVQVEAVKSRKNYNRVYAHRQIIEGRRESAARLLNEAMQEFDKLHEDVKKGATEYYKSMEEVRIARLNQPILEGILGPLNTFFESLMEDFHLGRGSREELITCQICASDYDQQECVVFVGGCGHQICSSCAVQLGHNKKKPSLPISCPVCKQSMSFAQNFAMQPDYTPK